MGETNYELSVPQLLIKAFHATPDKEVLFDGYRRLTYRDLQIESNQIAAGLSKMGIKKGDRIAICLPNWHEFVVLYFALSKMGVILVPFNTRYRTEEVEYILKNSGAKAAFFCREFDKVNLYEQFLEIKKRVHTLELLISVRFEAEGVTSFQKISEIGRGYQPPVIKLDPNHDGFTIIYTSGTTGKPKGALLTHKNVVYIGMKTAEMMHCTRNDIFLVAVPVFHVFGMVPCILSAIASGAKMVLMERFQAEEVLKIIQQEKITVHHGVPTMFTLELNHPKLKSYDISSLRTGIIAGAPCPVEVVRRIKSDMNFDILISFGMTEASPSLTCTHFDDDDLLKTDTVGRAIPGIEIKIVDQNRQEVPTGEVGEVAARSSGIMRGYYNMPEMTREVIDEEGWYYTGDLARMDHQGYLRIVGRKKDMIIRGGYNIYPREIEEVFYSHSSIMAVSIIGLPDTVLGEVTCAAIQLKSKNSVTVEEMRAYIKERVADYKVPDMIIFMEQLPMTPSGKISKMQVQIQLKNQLKSKLR
jgi:fatty-acyl-CoA synthase